MRISTLSFFFLLLTAAGFSQTYQMIEATEYDPTQNRWLTTNGNSIIAQAADGTLSFFGSGQANYGMEVMNGTLFAIYNGSVRGYDLVTGDQVINVGIDGAGVLNGMGSDPSSNRIWVSDFSNSKIIELNVADLNSPTYEVVVDDTGNTPNGVVYDQIDDRLVFTTWTNSNATLKAVDLDTYALSTVVTTSVGNIDGIDMDSDGRFYISSWSPTRITRYNHDFTNPITIPASGLSSPADISFANEINTLGVANSGNETLTLIEMEPNGLEDQELNPFGVQIFPNPVAAGSRITFDLQSDTRVDIVIRNVEGQVVQRIMSSQQAAGNHQVLFNGLELSEGYYLLEISNGETATMQPFVVAR